MLFLHNFTDKNWSPWIGKMYGIPISTTPLLPSRRDFPTEVAASWLTFQHVVLSTLCCSSLSTCIRWRNLHCLGLLNYFEERKTILWMQYEDETMEASEKGVLAWLVKLLLCDQEVTGSYYGNRLTKCKITLHTIRLWSIPFTDPNLVHHAAQTMDSNLYRHTSLLFGQIEQQEDWNYNWILNK